MKQLLFAFSFGFSMVSSPALAVAALEVAPVAVYEDRAGAVLETPGTALAADPIDIALAGIAVLLFALVIRRREPTTTD